jgi:hypothetical protein
VLARMLLVIGRSNKLWPDATVPGAIPWGAGLGPLPSPCSYCSGELWARFQLPGIQKGAR